MSKGRKAAAVAAASVTGVLVPILGAGVALAHGTMENPSSRAYTCFKEGAEHPSSAACQAAVAAGGPQAVYDWNGIRQPNAGGNSRQVVPDGKLCSGGNDEFKGFDLPRADWPATKVNAGADYPFSYKATAQHQGYFEMYITKNGFDPTKPLKWSDLEDQPFLKVDHPQVVNGSYQLPGKLPAGKSGHHLIYTIWQRTDSPEAFYACSDVDFGGGGSGGSTTPADPAPVSAASSVPFPSSQKAHQISAKAGQNSVRNPDVRRNDPGFLTWLKSLFG